MPDRGLLTRKGISAGPIIQHEAGVTWVLEGVRLAQVTFEVGREAALAFMPCAVSRPVPCYGRLMIVDADSTPVGRLRIAALTVGGRFRMMPRNVLVDGIVDGRAPEVGEWLGSPYRDGRVSMEREGAAITAAVAADEGQLATVDMSALSAVDPGMLRWDPWLAFADGADGPQIVECGIRPAARDAFLSKAARIAAPADLGRGHAWYRLRSLNMISACYVEGDLELSLPQVQEPVS